METAEQIEACFASHPEPKQGELRALHHLIQGACPGCRLWFADGRNEEGKVVANPNVGYGAYTIRYADGSTKEFYRVGISANAKGISVYILGLADKTLLAREYGERLGKAKVTGYCISFRSIQDINLDVLGEAVKFGFEAPRAGS